jgi:hypothetical protein
MRRPPVCSGHPSLSVNGLRSDLGRRTDAELAILSVLWRQGPCTVRESTRRCIPTRVRATPPCSS